MDSVKEHIKVESTLVTPEPANDVNALRKRLATEQKKVRTLTREKAVEKCNKRNLQELFLECVEAVKREVALRQVRKDEMSLSSLLNGDKRRVMELMLENDEFLEGIAKAMFPQYSSDKRKTLLTDFLAKAQEKKKTKSIADLMRIGKKKRRVYTSTATKAKNKPLTYL